MTREQAIAWVQSKLGQALDFDGQYGAQCFDLFNFYYQMLTGRNPYSDGFGVPGAKDIWNVRVPYFDYIKNDPNDVNQLPKPGDIIIYAGSQPGSGGYGHVAIVGESKQVYYEQNWGGMFVKRNTRAFTGHEIGWLSFKGFGNGDKPMNRDEEANAYRIVLGREMEHSGSGRTGYQFIVAAKAEIDAQKKATADAIQGLRNQLTSVQQALANEQAKPPKEVVKEVEKIVEKIVEVPKVVEVVKPFTDKDGVSWLTSLIRKLFKK